MTLCFLIYTGKNIIKVINMLYNDFFQLQHKININFIIIDFFSLYFIIDVV